MNDTGYKCIVIGVSAGGMDALERICKKIPEKFPLPIIVVQHLHSSQKGFLFEHLNSLCSLTVKDADEKEPIETGFMYFAPANYHLLVEDEKILSLSVDEKVNFSRPSIDVLFESAAYVYTNSLIGIVLTGANNDGALGLNIIKNNGGLTIVQNPEDASSPFMPNAAISMTSVDFILKLDEIVPLLLKILGV